MSPSFSLRTIALCVLFLFSTNAAAVAAVLGVDLGTEYIKATLVKPGIPLEIVLTKDSRRKETSAVAFKPSQDAPAAGKYPERAFGSDAIALAARFPGDVYPNLKTLLGLPTDDALVKEYAARHPALQLQSHKVHGRAAFKSKAFTDNVEPWMVEELLAMELQSIQRNAEGLAGADTSVRSVVITVPPFYTAEEKRAVEMAADLVGLKVLSLISDGLAVGLNYATSREFPVVNDGGKPEHHMIFDMGAGSTTATVLKFQGRIVKDIGKFNKTVQEIQVLGTGWDRSLGGDALNYLIVDDMISKFVESKAAQKISATAEGVQKHGRAVAKLLKEAERLRHILSANVDTQASFEGLYEDVDFKYKITRAEFEKMAELHAERVGTAVQKALELAELDIKQLDSIILHGGASRTPFVQKQLEKIAGSDKLRSNVNSDEAAVFGAGFRAAELSPSFRVKEIRVSDSAAYPAGMKWTNQHGKAQSQRLWTARSLLGAAPKEVTFNNQEDFAVQFFQQVPSNSDVSEVTDKETKTLTTKNLTDTVAKLTSDYGCQTSDIQVKVKLTLSTENGEVNVLSAAAECEAEETEKPGILGGLKKMFGVDENKEKPLGARDEGTDSTESAGESSSTQSTTESTNTATTSSVESSTTGSSASLASSAGAAESSPTPKKKALVSIPISFVTEKAGVPQLPKADLAAAKDRIKAFETSDKARRQREETLNQLEGFTYKIRDLLESESFVEASTAEERALLEKKAGEASDWLYGDGADATREELKSRLKSLKDLVSPVESRVQEAVQRPELVKNLRTVLNQTHAFIENVKKSIAEAEAWASSISGSASATSQPSASVTTAPSKSDSDFEGLEDDDTTSTTTTTTKTGAKKDPGPLPPLYTVEDLKEVVDMSEATFKWLEQKIAEQTKLAANAQPVLTIKDLQEKAKELEKAGMDLAMKGVKNFESKDKKKGSNAKKPSKAKKASGTKTDAAGSEQTIEFKDGEMPTKEELEEMIRKMTEESEAADKAGKTDKRKHDEL